MGDPGRGTEAGEFSDPCEQPRRSLDHPNELQEAGSQAGGVLLGCQFGASAAGGTSVAAASRPSRQSSRRIHRLTLQAAPIK